MSQEPKQCPYCAQPVTAAAPVCPVCNSRLKPIGTPPPSIAEPPNEPVANPSASVGDTDPQSNVASSNPYDTYRTEMTAKTGGSSIIMVAALTLIFVFAAAGAGVAWLVPMANKAKDTTIMANMSQVQRATEGYFASNHRFPLTEDDFKDSFKSPNVDPKHPPLNPFTNKEELPVIASRAADLPAIRSQTASSLAPGQIEYTPVTEGGAIRSYAIRGADAKGAFVRDKSNQIFILTH